MDPMDSLSAAVSAYSVMYYSNGDEIVKDLGEFTTIIKCILSNVQKLDPLGFDLGLSYSLSSSVIVKFGLVKQMIQTLVESICPAFRGHRIIPTKDIADDMFDNLIPLGAALEHPDPEQRLEAMDRLFLIKDETTHDIVESKGKGMSDGENVLLKGLLHRFGEDKDLRVVSKAAVLISYLVHDSCMLNLLSLDACLLRLLYQGLCNVAIIGRFHAKARSERPVNHTTSTKPAVDALLVSFKFSASAVYPTAAKDMG